MNLQHLDSSGILGVSGPKLPGWEESNFLTSPSAYQGAAAQLITGNKHKQMRADTHRHTHVMLCTDV